MCRGGSTGIWTESGRRLQQFVEGPSPKQKQVTGGKLTDLMKRDPDAIADSDAFRAFEAVLGMFGEVVFQASATTPPDGAQERDHATFSHSVLSDDPSDRAISFRKGAGIW